MKTVTISRLPCCVSTTTSLVTKPNAYSPGRGEGAAARGEKGVDHLVAGGICRRVDRRAQQERVAPGKHAPPAHVARDRAHDQDDRNRREESEPGNGASDDAHVHRRERVV